MLYVNLWLYSLKQNIWFEWLYQYLTFTGEAHGCFCGADSYGWCIAYQQSRLLSCEGETHDISRWKGWSYRQDWLHHLSGGWWNTAICQSVVSGNDFPILLLLWSLSLCVQLSADSVHYSLKFDEQKRSAHTRLKGSVWFWFKFTSLYSWSMLSVFLYLLDEWY